jgi:hypothetical protein
MHSVRSRKDAVSDGLAWAPWTCVTLHILGVAVIVTTLRHGTLAEPDVFAAIGLLCDLSGELTYTTVVTTHVPPSSPNHGTVLGAAPGPGWDRDSFLAAQAVARMLTAGFANALYTVGGILLTLRTTGVPGWVRSAMWCTWIAGALMTVSAVMSLVPADSPPAHAVQGLKISAAVLFPLLCVWIAWMGWRWR